MIKIKMKEAKNKEKVFVAMSGGVDSSVAAALLKKQGYEATGVFMRLTDTANSKGAEKKAKKVAKILKIPFLIWDFRKEFKKRVIDYFLEEYKRGRTPNPCVVCNPEIKFGLFLEKAFSLGADNLATGHYVRFSKNGKLMTARDAKKDQSYFLWRLKPEQLKNVIFPVGNYTKTQVRNLAKKFKLPVLAVRESQEICFIQTDIRDFLRRHLKPKPGKIITADGKIIGRHPGIFYFTIGQRHGLGISGDKPYYVAEKDAKTDTLIVAEGEKNLALYRKEIDLTTNNVNFIDPQLMTNNKRRVLARVRYRQPLATATLIIKRCRLSVISYKLIFDKPQKAVAPGQSAVFYSPAVASAKSGEPRELLGGGVIS